ncbi:MAG TPA: LytTR family DNA-binding domain-containing protein [Rhodocyclaceae bacterium]
MTPLRLALVDDEAPARARLRDLLQDIADAMPTEIVCAAASGVEALELLADQAVDVVLTDIHMPRMNGLQLALHLARLSPPPAVIFVTAFDQYAVQAFELSATDYLLKPVRAERLLEALRRCRPGQPPEARQLQALAPGGREHLRCTERGRVLLIPLDEVLYLKAELKYVTVRTRGGEHVLEESLAQLEQEFGPRFVRVHRNCLVALAAVRGYERERGEAGEVDSEARWVLLLQDIDEHIAVSRRQWPQVKSLLKG